MRNDDTPTTLDREDFDGDDAEVLGLDASGAEPAERFDDPDADPDDAVLAAELGEHDIALDDALDADEDIEDEPAEDDEDDLEMALLHELGIDLDAPDEPSDLLEALAPVDDSAVDDEVAA
jgi:hypothetical protein